jgi:hypothetical protein
LIGLASWEKHPLEYEHAMQYVSDMRKEADNICKKSFHRNCVYDIHKKYGNKIQVYRRNKQTQWNLIYNWEKFSRIAYVNKILNNYLTRK